MPDASWGTFARLSFGAVGTPIAQFDEPSEFVSETIHREQTLLSTAGLRGTRAHPIERTRDGVSLVRGSLRLHATPQLLTQLLPRILGTAVGNQFLLAEQVPEFDILIDRVARRFLYHGCRVDRAVFQSRAGGLLEVGLEVAGKSESVTSDPFPEITTPNDQPFVFHDAILVIAGISRPMLRFELAVENHLAVRHANNATPSDIIPIDRQVRLRCTVPFTSSEVDLYARGSAGAASAALTFTNGTRQLSFTMPAVVFPANSPTVPGREEVTLTLDGTAHRTSASAELVVTNSV